MGIEDMTKEEIGKALEFLEYSNKVSPESWKEKLIDELESCIKL